MAKRFRVPEIYQFRPMTWDELEAHCCHVPAKPFKQVVHDAKYWMTLPRSVVVVRLSAMQKLHTPLAKLRQRARVGGGRRPTEEARRADVVPPL
jgi:hypothetical protein